MDLLIDAVISSDGVSGTNLAGGTFDARIIKPGNVLSAGAITNPITPADTALIRNVIHLSGGKCVITVAPIYAPL